RRAGVTADLWIEGDRASRPACRTSDGDRVTTGTGKYERLLERCSKLDPVPTAVAHPCEQTALAGAIEAADKGLITPILVGPTAKIEAIAPAAGVDLRGSQVVDTPHSQASAMQAL